jgi:hypothetical protein
MLSMMYHRQRLNASAILVPGGKLRDYNTSDYLLDKNKNMGY